LNRCSYGKTTRQLCGEVQERQQIVHIVNIAISFIQFMRMISLTTAAILFHRPCFFHRGQCIDGQAHNGVTADVWSATRIVVSTNNAALTSPVIDKFQNLGRLPVLVDVETDV
jgi:hypothetical protein